MRILSRVLIWLPMAIVLYTLIAISGYIRSYGKVLSYDQQIITYEEHHGLGDSDFNCQVQRLQAAQDEARNLTFNAIVMLRRWNEDYLSEQPPCLLTPAPRAEKLLTDKEKIALLRAEAKKRHIKWRITCDKYGFFGVAWREGTPRYAQYYEDGRRDWWSTRCGGLVVCETQADAAESLYVLIQGASNQPAEHKLTAIDQPHSQCPPEITDESRPDCKLCEERK